MIETLLTNSITIIIALIAGMVALYQVKSNVISDARIKWIESLRETLSLYCAELEKCSNAKLEFLSEHAGKTSEKDLEVVRDKYFTVYANSSKEVLMLQSKIFLYLNSKKPHHKKVEELIRKSSLIIHAKKEHNPKEVHKNIEEIIRTSKEIFRVEWKKSKKIFKI